jgi:hypothetical protein
MKKLTIATGSVILIVLSTLSAFAQTESRENTLTEIEAKRAELAALEKRFLSPSEEDRATYADFLRQPNTGLIRLLPREKYENNKALTVRGGGAYYSFSRLTHEYGYGSDIELAQNFLSTGFAGADYGILTNYGNIPLEEITLEGVPFLASYAPADELPKARIEQRKWSESATVDDITYTRRVLLKKNSTYLLRSVNYDSSDVLVAFKVVRVDDDGSATILWKLLKQYPTPKLARK